MGRLIDAEVLYKSIEDRKAEMTSETVKAGLTLAQAIVDATPTSRVMQKPAYIDAEKIAEMVAEKLK